MKITSAITPVTSPLLRLQLPSNNKSRVDSVIGNVSLDGGLPMPVGKTYRGLFSDWFNAGNIAKEDWLRAEQSNQIEREFNAAEAQKNRDFQDRMAKNTYTYAVEDMKRAGINPILQYANHSMSLPQGSNAYSSNAQSNYRGKAANTGEFLSFLSSLASIGAGLYTHGAFSPITGKIGF